MDSATRSAASESTGGGARQLVLALLVLSLLAMAGTYYWSSVLTAHDQQYLGILGDEQVLSQEVAKNTSEAAHGKAEAFGQLKKATDAYEQNLLRLRKGELSTGLPPLPRAVDKPLAKLESLWRKTADNVSLILKVQGPITGIFENVRAFDKFAAEAQLKADELVNIMVESGASPEQVYFGTRQLMLLERISNNMGRTLQGGEGAVKAADRFGQDAVLFREVVEALLNGDPRLGIEAVTTEDARGPLEQIASELKQEQPTIDGILTNSIELFRVQDAAAAVLGASNELLATTQELRDAYRAHVDGRLASPLLGNVFAALALAMLIVIGMQMTRDARVRAEGERLRAEEAHLRAEEARAQEEASKETNRRNQEAILRLLDEISSLADGDLTVSATVTEDFTGAIADAINYAVEEMRGLVANINTTSVQVASAAQGARDTAIALSETSETQAGQIQTATAAISAIAAELERLSREAGSASEVAQSSVDTANKGATAVRDTIAGMDAIRETIQETSKRIKRLGESSQEIGDIVGLIDDIADQTNILALNAAIQASMAGEAGRGFAVVADEVQRLAERSSQATRQIEGLVKTIQSDTNDAVISMEKSTSGVVEGAKVAEGAGEALAEIERVSNRLAELIGHTAQAASQQADEATGTSASMNTIRHVTLDVTKGTRETALSIGKLAELADQLRKSVADFNLPTREAQAVQAEAAAGGGEEPEAVVSAKATVGAG